MNHRPFPVRSLQAAALLLLLALPSCGSSSYKLPIAVDPPTAAVFVNGTRVGLGARRVYELNFGSAQRICLQAAAPGYEPLTEMLSQQQVEDQLSKVGYFTFPLKQER